VLGADRAEDLSVDHVRRDLVDVCGEASCDLTRPGRVRDDLEQARCINYQRCRIAPAEKPGPK
jgi:hypothetical protein